MVTDLKNKLATKADNPAKAVTTSPEQTIYAYLKRMAPEIQRALPKHLDADRLARIAFTTIRTTPKLLNCNVQSLMGSVMMAAQLGLEPGLLGHCYILPFENRKKGTTEAQFIIGYRGMIDLARRSGNVLSITVHEVYTNDFFEMSYGIEDNLKHIPWHLREDEPQKEPGEIRGFYMIAKFKDGGYQIHYMSKQEVDAHRKRSKTSDFGPWQTDYIEMGKKTVIRSAWKWLPISVEIMKQVVGTDETVKSDIAPDMADVPTIEVDGTWEEPQQEETPAPTVVVESFLTNE